MCTRYDKYQRAQPAALPGGYGTSCVASGITPAPAQPCCSHETCTAAHSRPAGLTGAALPSEQPRGNYGPVGGVRASSVRRCADKEQRELGAGG